MISGDSGGDARARICGSSDRGSESQSLGRNFRLETDDFCLACFVFALDGTGISGISGILGTGGGEGLVKAASVPGCRVELSDGFLDKGETSLLKLIDLATVSSTGDTWGDDVSVATDVAAIIDGLIEFV